MAETTRRETWRSGDTAEPELEMEGATFSGLGAGGASGPGLPAVSPSVRRAAEAIGGSPTPAAGLVRELLDLHREYGGGRAETVELPEEVFTRPGLTVAEWLLAVRSLFVPAESPELNGRLVVAGLAQLDSALGQALRKGGFLDALEAEITPAIENMLTEEGRRLRRETETRLSDSAPTVSDSPALLDRLQRRAFAEVVAIRMRRLREEEPDRSFLLHIDGPWGAGKTSLLAFLRQELSKADPAAGGVPWVVVDFNAWQHQRIRPPWWPLLRAVYRHGSRQLDLVSKLKLRARNVYWGLSLRGAPVVFAALALLALGIFIALAVTPDEFELDASAESAQLAGAILAFFGTVWGGLVALGRLIFPGSASGARRFVQSNADPMRRLAAYYGKLTSGIGRPVAIFIDDLDRCSDEYVVEFLEGIQTLFREQSSGLENSKKQRTTFATLVVVAADRRWLRASYENTYANFTESVEDPAVPLGYLFLEKVFQLSTPLPRLTPELQKRFLQAILRSGGEQAGEQMLETISSEARHELGERSEAEDIQDVVEAIPEEQSLRKLAYQGEAAKRFASRTVERQTRHALEQYIELMGSNPRSMKRLVNAYGIQLSIASLEGKRVDTEQLALSTILSMRWPLLGEFLWHNPEEISALSKGEVPKALPKAIASLLKDKDVRSILERVSQGARPVNDYARTM